MPGVNRHQQRKHQNQAADQADQGILFSELSHHMPVSFGGYYTLCVKFLSTVAGNAQVCYSIRAYFILTRQPAAGEENHEEF